MAFAMEGLSGRVHRAWYSFRKDRQGLEGRILDYGCVRPNMDWICSVLSSLGDHEC